MEYERFLSDIRSCVDSSKLSSVLSMPLSQRRTGLVLDVFREAFLSSTLSGYNNCTYWFNGRNYEIVSDMVFSNLVYDLLKCYDCGSDIYMLTDRFVRVLTNAVRVRELEVHNSKIAFSNCVLDVETGEVRDFGSDVVVFSSLDYPYDKDAKCWRWLTFLDEVLPDKVFQRVLQEFVGSIFIDRHKAKVEHMLILKGSGANGKSVVFEVITNLLGKDNVSNFSLTALLGNNLERKRNVADMNGKRLNYASETDRLHVVNGIGALKALISGEPMEGRAVHGKNFIARDIPLMMMNTNVMPQIEDWSFGMRRRITVLPFDVQIPKWRQDLTLASSLCTELSGIMNWALEGYKRFVGNQYHYTESATLNEMLDTFRNESSSTLRFMSTSGYESHATAVRDMPPVWVLFGELYEEYRKWCVVLEEHPDSRTMFSMKLRESGFRIRLRRDVATHRHFVALYGDRALMRNKWLLMCKHAAAELNAKYKGERFYNSRMITEAAQEVMAANNWNRCAVGVADLHEYLGYTFNVPNHINTGKLEGCYVVKDGVYFFDLTAIDKIWRPKYEEGIKERFRRGEVEKIYRVLEDEAKAELSKMGKQDE